mgnify:CR=1 FL=1
MKLFKSDEDHFVENISKHRKKFKVQIKVTWVTLKMSQNFDMMYLNKIEIWSQIMDRFRISVKKKKISF